MSRKLIGLLIALGVLFFAADTTGAMAAAKKHHAGHKAASSKVAAHHKGGRKLAKASPKSQPVVITTKAATDAPDFDFQPRIQEAQALAAKQPVLPDDMVVERQQPVQLQLGAGGRPEDRAPDRGAHGRTGQNDQGFIVTWPVDNFLNTKFHVETRRRRIAPHGLHRLRPAPPGARQERL